MEMGLASGRNMRWCGNCVSARLAWGVYVARVGLVWGEYVARIGSCGARMGLWGLPAFGSGLVFGSARIRRVCGLPRGWQGPSVGLEWGLFAVGMGLLWGEYVSGAFVVHPSQKTKTISASRRSHVCVCLCVCLSFGRSFSLSVCLCVRLAD